MSLSSINSVRRPSIFAALALVAFLFTSLAPRAASADGAASTRNIILGAAALAAGVIVYNNVQHKRAVAANTVVGYTRDGGVVYGDGRIAYSDGRRLYASNGDGRSCGYGRGQERCGARPGAYHREGDRDRDDRSWSRHHKHDNEDNHGEHDHHDGGDR